METPAFGGIIKPQDPRDYDLHAVNMKLGSAAPISASNNDYSSIPIDMQAKQPACGAHAGARLKNILNLRAAVANLHSSPRYNWKNMKDIDGEPIEAGTTINALFKSMRTKGVCKFDLTGNDVDLDLITYRNLPVTPEMDVDALTNTTEAEAYIYHPTWEQICQTIDLHGACVMLLRVGQNMYNPSWNEADILPLNPTKFPLDSGHFVVAENYDQNYIYFGNSWSNDWGRNGIGYLGREYIPYIVAIGTCVNKSDLPPKYQFTRDLGLGSFGKDVTELQKRLGMIPSIMWPVFGPQTKKLVIQYQLAHGINPTGYVGPITRASLNS